MRIGQSLGHLYPPQQGCPPSTSITGVKGGDDSPKRSERGSARCSLGTRALGTAHVRCEQHPLLLPTCR